jgi:multiple sugar transport system permease protein
MQRTLSKYGTGLLFLVPAVIVYGLFQWIPIGYNLVLGFQNYVPGIDPEWVGLDNFRAVLQDPLLGRATVNTLYYVGMCLVFGYLLPVLVALLLSELPRGKGFMRLGIYLPKIIPGIALYIIWVWIFHPSLGALNSLAGLVGIPPQQWLLSKETAMLSLVIMSTWAGFGGTAVLYLASMTGIREELYEAAELEGAGILQRIRHVTLPALAPTMKLLFLLQLIATLQVLQEPFVMTGGGPDNATVTLMMLVYNHAFVNAEFGKAGALGALIFLVLFVLSLIYIVRAKVAEGEAGS